MESAIQTMVKVYLKSSKGKETLGKKEFQGLVKSQLGNILSDSDSKEAVNNMGQGLDADHDGKVGFEEYMKLVGYLAVSLSEQRALAKEEPAQNAASGQVAQSAPDKEEATPEAKEEATPEAKPEANKEAKPAAAAGVKLEANAGGMADVKAEVKEGGVTLPEVTTVGLPAAVTAPAEAAAAAVTAAAEAPAAEVAAAAEEAVVKAEEVAEEAAEKVEEAAEKVAAAVEEEVEKKTEEATS